MGVRRSSRSRARIREWPLATSAAGHASALGSIVGVCARFAHRWSVIVVLAACVGALVVVVLVSRPSGGPRPPEVGQHVNLGSFNASAPRAPPRSTPRTEALPSGAQVRAAHAFARGRLGLVAFAVVDTSGGVRCHRCRRRFVSASLVKAMLLLAYLERLDAERRPLVAPDRALLEAMIRVSDNRAADAVYARVGDAGLYELARRAGMRSFDVSGHWANAQLTAADQALLFARLCKLPPRNYRAYARALLSSIVRSQSWGMPRVARHRWRTYFKGGWRGTALGELVHQAARLEHGRRSMAIAVLTDGNPTRGYAVATVQGIAERLLRRGSDEDRLRRD
jgi:beta-lactamase class A